jgi:ABC-2 type transport system ATP-binding protein
VIEAQNLTKCYGRFVAVSGASFSVPEGRVAAFLGPNGAGKSTIMKMLTGFISPDAGMARIHGYEIALQRVEAARLIGYLPENGPLYPDMTPRELLRFFGEARGISAGVLKERLDFVVERCSLAEIYDKAIHKLSKGNRQRVGMAQAILHDPKVLILDEPTGGLDPNQIRQVRSLIGELGKTRTILLSTHILQEVGAIAEQVIFINEGSVVFDGSVEELKQKGPDLEAVFAQLTATTEVA